MSPPSSISCHGAVQSMSEIVQITKKKKVICNEEVEKTARKLSFRDLLLFVGFLLFCFAVVSSFWFCFVGVLVILVFFVGFGWGFLLFALLFVRVFVVWGIWVLF